MAKQQLCTCITLFLYISLPSLPDYNVEVPKFTVYRGREHTNRISALNFEAARIHFLSDVLVAVAVVVA